VIVLPGIAPANTGQRDPGVQWGRPIRRKEVMPVNWVKSSFSVNDGNCVEVAAVPERGAAVRDSQDPAGPMLRFTASAWRAFVNERKGA
jgi:hypothetical protein